MWVVNSLIKSELFFISRIRCFIEKNKCIIQFLIRAGNSWKTFTSFTFLSARQITRSANPTKKTPQTKTKPLKFSPNGDTSHTINNANKKKNGTTAYASRLNNRYWTIRATPSSRWPTTAGLANPHTDQPAVRPRFSEEFSDAHKETRRHFFILLSSSSLRVFSSLRTAGYLSSHLTESLGFFLVQVINFTWTYCRAEPWYQWRVPRCATTTAWI